MTFDAGSDSSGKVIFLRAENSLRIATLS